MSEIKALNELRNFVSKEFDEWRFDRLNEIADGIEAEIAANYLELPKDADGIPWTLETESFVDDTGRKVEFSGLKVDRKRRWKIFSNCIWYEPSLCHHAKPDPLKELLNDHLQEREKIVRKLENNLITLGEAESEEDACDKLFAERIRELLGGDAE